MEGWSGPGGCGGRPSILDGGAEAWREGKVWDGGMALAGPGKERMSAKASLDVTAPTTPTPASPPIPQAQHVSAREGGTC